MGTMERVVTTACAVSLLFLLLLASASALPNPPPPPGDPFPSSNNGITLLSPDDRSFFRETRVNFSFSPLEDATNCSLRINGALARSPWTNVVAGGVIAYVKTGLASGEYTWSVVCTFVSGPIVESDERTFTIDTAPFALVAESGTVEQGYFLRVNGSHYTPGDVDINLTNSSGAVINQMGSSVSSDGKFSANQYFKFTFPPGAYTIVAWQDGVAGSSKSVPVTLTKRVVSVSTDKESYAVGDTVTFNGVGFSPSATLTLTIKKPDGGEFVKTFSSLGSGAFTTTYALSPPRTAGTYTVLVNDVSAPGLNASTRFVLVAGAVPPPTTPCASPDRCLASAPANGYARSGFTCASGSCYMCSPGYHWDTNACVQDTTCFATCASGETRCSGSGVQSCIDVNGCMIWGVAQDCPYGEECSDSQGCVPVNVPSPNIPEDPELQEPGIIGFSLLWISLAVIVLILLGTGAYLVYEGKLDLHDIGGSLKALFHPESRGAGPKASAADYEEVKHFIFSERTHGYDDLAIRNSLIERGWGSSDVDKVFEQIYAA